MASFKEVVDQLSKAIDDVGAKKAILDDLTVKIQAANTDYLSSLDYARSIKTQMSTIMNDTIPEASGDRVR